MYKETGFHLFVLCWVGCVFATMTSYICCVALSPFLTILDIFTTNQKRLWIFPKSFSYAISSFVVTSTTYRSDHRVKVWLGNDGAKLITSSSF